MRVGGQSVLMIYGLIAPASTPGAPKRHDALDAMFGTLDARHAGVQVAEALKKFRNHQALSGKSWAVQAMPHAGPR